MQTSPLQSTMKRQAAFRGAHKRKQVLKGASTLNFNEFEQYDTSIVHDHESKSSEKVAKSGIDDIIHLEGDHDVWVEKILISKKTGKPKVFFISKKTGQKVANEPPTGATRVFYLRDSFKETKLSSIVPEQNDKTPNLIGNVAEFQKSCVNNKSENTEKCVSSAIAGQSEACEGQGTSYWYNPIDTMLTKCRSLFPSRYFALED